MQKIEYLKIQHFKVFGDEVSIQLDNPTILIGANNSGKTTVIQALALWSWAVRIWHEKKKKTKSKAELRKGVALNRLEIAQVPIKETRYFWNNAKVRQNSNDNIGLTIKVGLRVDSKTHEIGMIFKYHSSDLMYCQPTESSFETALLLDIAASLKVNLLYPMSGMNDKEFVLQEDAVRTQIGIGQTANVLRNICYNLHTKNVSDWNYLVELMKTLFSIELKSPFVRASGVIEVVYNYVEKAKKADYDLDITLAGRGQLQMLLILAYLLANPNSVMMIDEPDAHLEILRQTQIFSVLKKVAEKYNSQIIIVTHSEAVLNEASSVMFIIDGQAQEISDKNQHKFIKDSIKNYGIEHYYKAKINPHILYLEGSTDKDMLMAFASKFNHPVSNVLDGRLNFYYTKNENAEEDLSEELQRKSGAYTPYKQHFGAIKKVVSHFKGIGIFDSDNKNRQDEVSNDLGIYYWKWYELENYFVSPETVLAYAKSFWESKHQLEGLFLHNKLEILKEIIEEEMILSVMNGDRQALSDFKNLPNSLQNVQFQNFAANKKMSGLLEKVFQKLSVRLNEPILLSKGEFYHIIPFLNNMHPEVEAKLDLLLNYLSDT